MIPQFARHVDQFGYQSEGSELADFVRNKTPTYTDEPSEQRTYSQAWETWGQDPIQDPICCRAGAKSKAAGEIGSGGAAASAPDRSTSVGSWIGRELLPPPKKGKGRGEETSPQQWQPSLRTSSPSVLPLSTKAGPLSGAKPPKQPSAPPPKERAPAPVPEPRRYSFSIRSLKPHMPNDPSQQSQPHFAVVAAQAEFVVLTSLNWQDRLATQEVKHH